MKHKNVLLIARPDHSLQIYEALEKQDELSYTFLSFKVVPHWLKRMLFNWNRLSSVGKNALISIKCTIVNLIRFKYHFWFSDKIKEDNILGNRVKAIFKKCYYDIVHYWPLYAYKEVEKWAQIHPDSLVVADVHFPNPEVVLQEMVPVYKKYNLDFTETVWPRHLSIVERIMKGAPALMFPSTYVADTYKSLLPSSKVFIVTYGIRVSPNYVKRSPKSITSFVFAGGTISLEKGCDLLCEYFANHPGLTLHLFGECPKEQSFIFDRYRGLDNITFHGHIPRTELQNKIIEYDAGIHLSRFDAYSLSVGEIIGGGLPVVVSNRTGNASEVEKYGLGIVTDLTEEAINESILDISNFEVYNNCVEHIDYYIRHIHRSYGEKMIEFYKQHSQ